MTGFVSKRSKNSFRFTAVSFSKMNIIINYFKLFPLKSFKKETFEK
jgi:hypothetical protein